MAVFLSKMFFHSRVIESLLTPDWAMAMRCFENNSNDNSLLCIDVCYSMFFCAVTGVAVSHKIAVILWHRFLIKTMVVAARVLSLLHVSSNPRCHSRGATLVLHSLRNHDTTAAGFGG